MNPGKDWQGQNIPRVHTTDDGTTVSVLPVLEFLLQYDQDTLAELLPNPETNGWGEALNQAYGWMCQPDRIVYFTPDLKRYGCLPAWFPEEDSQGQKLTPQGQVDRFLYFLDYLYGHLPDDHRQASTHLVVESIIRMEDNMMKYIDVEEDDEMEWEKA